MLVAMRQGPLLPAGDVDEYIFVDARRIRRCRSAEGRSMVKSLKKPPPKRFSQQRVAAIAPRDEADLERDVDAISKLSMEELEELMRTDEGVRQFFGPLHDPVLAPTRPPKFSKIVEAVPGRLTREELLRVLSGGTRSEWGPFRRIAKRLTRRYSKD